MRLLRGLAGALLWLLGMLLGLVAVVLCVTIILLPLGILLFKPARRLIDRAIRLMLPRPVANPAASMKRGSKKARGKAKDAAPDLGVDTKKLAAGVAFRVAIDALRVAWTSVADMYVEAFPVRGERLNPSSLLDIRRSLPRVPSPSTSG